MRRAKKMLQGVAVAAALSLVLSGIALADNLLSDGDGLAPLANNDLVLGDVCAGSQVTRSVPVWLVRNGSATGTNTFANGATVTLSASTAVTSTTGGSLGASMASPGTITLPGDWTGVANNTKSDSRDSTVTFTAPSTPGSFSGRVDYSARGLNTGGVTITRPDAMLVTANVVSCNSAPSVLSAADDATGNEGDTLGTSGSFSDPDDDALTITKLSGAGTVTDNGDGSWNWSLSTSDQTSGSVTVQASDGRGGMTTDEFTYSAVNVAPTTPGQPTFSAGSNPSRTGAFQLDWAASQDVDAVTYALQHKDTDDATWSNLASGLTATSYSFTEGEGTWAYRVIATDKDSASSAPSDELSGVKVDKSAPNKPTVSAPAPDYSGASGDWYKDSVRLGVSDNGDPTLLDGSLGSGVDPQSYSASIVKGGGIHTISGITVKDNAGNESAAADSLTVKVDAVAPSLELSCPSNPVTLGSTAYATWTASDGESGLATANQGQIALDASAVGAGKLATALAGTAQDNVGHDSVEATCSYDVVFNFDGFYRPIDNKDATGKYVLNVAKAGSAIPVKFSLAGNQGLSIFQAGYPKAVAITCDSGTSADQIEETATATTSGLKYDSLTDQYNYTWKTDSRWAGSCRQLQVKLVDGQTYMANFKFTK